MMRNQLGADFIDNPEQFLAENAENIDFFVKNLKIRAPKKLEKQGRSIENGHEFPRITNSAELKREAIRIEPTSDAEMRRMRMEVYGITVGDGLLYCGFSNSVARRNNMVVQQAQLVESDHSDDESDDESPDEKSPEDSEDSEENSEDVPEDTENSEKEKEEKEEKEEKVTFADILKKSLSVEESEESTSGISRILGPNFSKNLDSGPSWGPSKLGLVTDDVEHLPSISANRPPLETKESEEIDALLGENEEDFYDLDDFEDGEEKNEEEEKVPEKPVNIVSPIVQKKKEEVTTIVPQVDPLVLSDESIDELEDFDAGALSSGGSDFSW
ncbi:Protein CBG05101 [Caenorhabditis briggsae]|uniref:Protein CBG05101 n=1 Tax=Caenorhabditis briggsae TaxID=6238 RepID=A8WZ90_CAEBR|nr:Protein CBG05101 [Caenorhabditis briggsae]CAP25700.2 Protein CBG05101 [Caenorhabditis briggsae]